MIDIKWATMSVNGDGKTWTTDSLFIVDVSDFILFFFAQRYEI